MILSSNNYDRGCIIDNGFIESSIVDAKGYKVTGNEYIPVQSGGQQSDWRANGYKADGNAFIIDIKGITYINKKFGDGNTRCRICAKPKTDYEDDDKVKFILKGKDSSGNPIIYDRSLHNCLCTKIRNVGGIKEENLNNNPDLHHIDIREKPTAITDSKYCPIYTEGVSQYKECKIPGTDNQNSESNWSCTDQFFIDLNKNNEYDPAKEDIVYNDQRLEYINLNYNNKDTTKKEPDHQETCYNDAGYNAYIGLFGYNGETEPTKEYELYSEFFLKDVDKYRYSSPNNQLYPGHKAGEEIKVKFKDGYYEDNSGHYNIYFIEGVLDKEYNGILTNIVNTIEGLFYNDGALEKSYNKIVSNSIFKAIVRLTLILYLLFMGFGILSGTMEISRQEFFSKILKISLIIFFTSPDSWSWYNGIVVGFFIGSIETMSNFTLNLDLFHISSDIRTLEQQSSVSGNASKFAFPDEMIKIFFSSENVFIKLWSLLFSPFNIAAIIIIAGVYIIMIYFIYIMVKIVIVYLTLFSSSILLLSLGPLAFILTVHKITSTFFQRWLVTLGARSIEIVMVFLVLYAFLSIINDKIGLYGQASPESLLYFESCPANLFDLFKWSGKTGLTIGDIDSETATDKVAEAVLRSLLSFFTIYAADPTKGIDSGDGTGKFVGDKDFFEMILIIMEVIILLYFLDMVISQIGIIASGLISYQQQSARVNSIIGGISREGSAIFGNMMDSNSFIIGSAKSMVSSGVGYAKRIGPGSAKFLQEHDGGFRALDSASGGLIRKASSYIAKSRMGSGAGDRIRRANSYIADSRIGSGAGRAYSSITSAYSSITPAYSSITSNEAYNNAELSPKIKSAIKKAETKFNSSKEGLNIESAIRSQIINQVSLEGASVSKMHTVTSILNTHFVEKNILSVIQDLIEKDPLLTNIEATKKVKLALRNNIKNLIQEDNSVKYNEQDLEKEVERQFNIKYLDNKFDDLLKKVIKENLSDEKVYKNFDIEHKKIVIRIMSEKSLSSDDITTQTGYNALQKKLYNDAAFKNLQRKIIAHQAHNNSKGTTKRNINYVSNKIDISFDEKYKEFWGYVNRERHTVRQTSTENKIAFGAALIMFTPIFVASAAISTPFVAIPFSAVAINYLYRSKYKSSIGLSAIATGGGKDTYLRAFRDIRVNEKRQTIKLTTEDRDKINDTKYSHEEMLKKAYYRGFQSDKDLNIAAYIEYNTIPTNKNYETDVAAENIRDSVYHMLKAEKIYKYKQEVAKERGLTSDHKIENDADVKSAKAEYEKQKKRFNQVIGSESYNEAAKKLRAYNDQLKQENKDLTQNRNNNNYIEILIKENENFAEELDNLSKQ